MKNLVIPSFKDIQQAVLRCLCIKGKKLANSSLPVFIIRKRCLQKLSLSRRLPQGRLEDHVWRGCPTETPQVVPHQVQKYLRRFNRLEVGNERRDIRWWHTVVCKAHQL